LSTVKAHTMLLRPSARVLAAAGAIALTAVLSSCGFDYATDRDYTPGAGTNSREGLIDVLGATVVSAQEGSGTFIASFANNDTDEPGTVETLTAETIPTADEEVEQLKVVEFEPIEVPAHGLVSLAQEGGIVITGELAAGDFIAVTIGFGDGTSVDLEVPVMPDCNEWEGLDESADGAESEDQCTIEAPEPAEH
jgi:hypothetical protein